MLPKLQHPQLLDLPPTATLLPPLECSSIPNDGGCYAVYDQGMVVYIGSGTGCAMVRGGETGLRDRIRDHPQFHHLEIRYWLLPSWDAKAMEAYAIARHAPKFNKVFRPRPVEEAKAMRKARKRRRYDKVMQRSQ